jgi:hypothetical protein
VIGGRVVCPDCAYEDEYGSAERSKLPPVPRSIEAPLQSERLFQPNDRGEAEQ